MMNSNGKLTRRICAGFFAIYLLVMAYLMLFGRIRSNLDWRIYVKTSVNLIPMRTILDQLRQLQGRPELARFAIRNLGGNVLLFMPLGVFLPSLWLQQRRPVVFAATVAGSIALVESMQVVSLLGSWDVDDVLLNLVGALMGFGCWRLGWKRITLGFKN